MYTCMCLYVLVFLLMRIVSYVCVCLFECLCVSVCACVSGCLFVSPLVCDNCACVVNVF